MTEPQLSQVDMRERMDQTSVSGIFIYPIKSCAGSSLDFSEVVSTGLKNDRRMMLMYPNGHFITQRRTNDPEHSEQAKDPTNKLATIHPFFINDGLLRIEAPNMPSDLYVEVKTDGQILETAVHSQTGIQVVDQGSDATKWFKEYLGFDCKLVAMAEDYTRQVDPRYATEADQTLFADGFPILLGSTESVDDLNARRSALGLEGVPVNRFRPNIVISGGVPFGEDYLREIRIGDVTYQVLKPCARCEITGNDQQTGERTNPRTAPLATIGYRHGTNMLGSVGSFFFQNVIHQNTGSIKLGDQLQILQIDNKPNFTPDRAS